MNNTTGTLKNIGSCALRGVEWIDPLRFLAGCRKRRLNHAGSVFPVWLTAANELILCCRPRSADLIETVFSALYQYQYQSQIYLARASFVIKNAIGVATWEWGANCPCDGGSSVSSSETWNTEVCWTCQSVRGWWDLGNPLQCATRTLAFYCVIFFYCILLFFSSYVVITE